MVVGLPVACVHLDLVRGPDQLDEALRCIPPEMSLSLGVINGRNIWKTHLNDVLDRVEPAVETLGVDRVILAPSCSLLLSPVDLDLETDLPSEVRDRLAFAKQKLQELAVLKKALSEGRQAAATELKENADAFHRFETSGGGRNAQVRQRLAGLAEDAFSRTSPFPTRKEQQQGHLDLPLLPTTTIGSFPQTPQIRKARASFRKGQIDADQYREEMKRNIEEMIRFQEQAGLDVLVHGEPERNDMVEYFGEMLDGFAFTRNGWVQSYGSRCVKPPIIHSDVSRPEAMTLPWIQYAQSLTNRPVKGMLTGPITILQWSFVREDQPRKDTAYQIALAIRDEVADLEAAGTRVIQIDEPALREGLPLRQSEWRAYLDWAVAAFRLATSSVVDATQIHTHMCYADFNDIIEAVAALDADVISLEASRSGTEQLNVFADYKYPNDIGPGVYDIHSPRVPSTEEMSALLHKILQVLPAERVWVNPDCGLKTRGWEETEQAIRNMVKAALHHRAAVQV
jgi:5-methyltetrahydropteroyltriglutamate--homocysteine methyltransferase